MAAPWRTCVFLGRKIFEVHRCQGRLIQTAARVVTNNLHADRLTCASSVTISRSYSSIFHSLSHEELWDGVTGVSNAGRKKGRAKRGRKRVDFYKGKAFGKGKANLVFPGLLTIPIKNKEWQKIKKGPPLTKTEVVVAPPNRKFRTLPPLLRGWSGNRYPGQSVGPPDAIGDYTFEGFDTKVLEFKMVTNMTGTLGRRHMYSAFVVTGNKQGVAGFGLGKAQNGRSAIRMAKNRAGQGLMYIEMLDNHTVYHDMYSKFHKTSVFVHKKEKGYGLKCHRAIITLAQLIGLKDLHCKVEGSTKNVKAVTKAFFGALVNQETHQNLSDRLGLHVVQFSKERNYRPMIIASPSSGEVRTEEMIDEEEDLEMDYDRIYFGGRVEYKRPREKWTYENRRGFRRRQNTEHLRRNQRDLNILRLAGLT